MHFKRSALDKITFRRGATEKTTSYRARPLEYDSCVLFAYPGVIPGVELAYAFCIQGLLPNYNNNHIRIKSGLVDIH